MEQVVKRLGEWWLVVILVLILGALLLLRWQITTLKTFDPDELSHLHSAWLITHGSLPYKDFFTGYPPTFYLLLAPLTLWLPASDFLPIIVRQIFFVIFLGSMFLVYKLVRKAVNREFSLIAICLITSSVFFIERGVEIRPDTLIIFLWVLSVLLIGYKKKHYFWSGAATGLMAALSQKSVYGVAAIVYLVVFTAWADSLRLLGEKRWHGFIKSLVGFTAGFVAFPLVVLAYIWQNHLLTLLPDFLIKYPLLIGGEHQWEHPWYHLGFIDNFTHYSYFYYFYKGSTWWLRSSQVIWVGALGLTIFWFVKDIFLRKRLMKKGGGERDFFLAFLGPGLVLSAAYLLTIALKIPQYWLIPTPFVMVSLVFGLWELSTNNEFIKEGIIVFACLGLAITTAALWQVWTNDLVNNNNFRQRENIRAVLEYTKPTDKGYDGVGSYLFRQDCFYFSLSLPQEIPPPFFRSIIGNLNKGKCDFVLKGPFSHWVDWGIIENSYVDRHFLPLTADPDVLVRKR